MRGWVIAVLFFAAAGLSLAGGAHAATYKFTDKSGAVGLADDLQSIPEDCRASAVLISGGSTENATAPGTSASPAPQAVGGQPAAAPAPAPSPAAAPEPREQGLPFSIRLAISIGVVIATILVSVFLGRISAMHGHDRAIHILRISLSWLVVVYLVAAHAKDVISIFKTAGSQVQSVSDAAAKKGQKAATVIKSMDDLVQKAAEQAEEHDKTMKEAEKGTDK